MDKYIKLRFLTFHGRLPIVFNVNHFFQNETGYTKFPVKFRKLEMFPTGGDYKGFTMQIEAPMETRFQCRADNRPINVPSTLYNTVEGEILTGI